MKKIHIIDATNKSFGRLASEVAKILMGKHRPDYRPNVNADDSVEVVNFLKAKFSGQKYASKKYYRHTGYVGNIKRIRLEEMIAKNPKKVLELAVKRMLPDNKLRAKRIKRLKISL